MDMVQGRPIGRHGGRSAPRGPKRRPDGRRSCGVGFFLPAELELDAHLPDELRRYADCARYLIGRIVAGRVFWEADGNGYVPLKVAYLRTVTPDRVEKALRERLVAAGIVECDGRWVRGEKSMGYRLAGGFDGPTRWVACSDPKVAARIRRINDRERAGRARLDVHRHLRKWIRRLNVDLAAADEVVMSEAALAVHAELHLSNVRMIASGRSLFTSCSFGRVHTNVTRLAKELRPCLRMGGRRLGAIDVVNSQPLLLALVVAQNRGREDCTTSGPYTPQAGAARGRSVITMSNSAGDVAEVIGQPGVRSRSFFAAADEERYLRLCEDGCLYEHMVTVLRGAGLLVGREDIKHEFFRLYYGPTTPLHLLKSEVSRAFAVAFAAEFPSVLRVIRAVKRRASNYRILSHRMQRAESRLIIETVCHRLMQEHPHVPLVTIHDSILTTSEYLALVRSAMRDAYSGLGLRPRFKVERVEDDDGQSAAA